MIKKLICISCPVSCRLELEEKDGDITVSGNKCPRGEIYAREEFLSPKRMVTPTCKVRSEKIVRLPVKSDKPVLKEDISGLLEEIHRLEITPPVRIGDVLIADYKNTGVNVIATRNVIS